MKFPTVAGCVSSSEQGVWFLEVKLFNCSVMYGIPGPAKMIRFSRRAHSWKDVPA